jgi:periplasmic protein TonB
MIWMKHTAKLAVSLSLLLTTALFARVGQNHQQSPTPNQTATVTSPENPKTEVAPRKEPAKFLSGTDPDYSESAREKHIEGTVILAVTLSEKGKVRSVKVVSPLESSLDRRAMKAVKHWKFTPATLDGKPVPAEFNVSVDFRLNR